LQYHGNGKIVLFSNIVEKLSGELTRKKIKPRAVYFCPSCDPFQPVPEVLDNTYKAMEMLLKINIGVQFSTKAIVPLDFIELFSKYSNIVCAQIGLNSVDDEIRKIFEPATASVAEKLMTMQRLVEIGIATTARADPLVCDVMDSDSSMVELFSAISRVGIKEITISFLFLRPAIQKSLERNINDKPLLDKLLKPYCNGIELAIGIDNWQVISLSKETRQKAFKKIRHIASIFDISVKVCGCKNSDITNEFCHITNIPHIQVPKM